MDSSLQQIPLAQRHGLPVTPHVTCTRQGWEGCPFSSTDIAELKREVIETLASRGLHLERDEGDGVDVLVDFRFIGLLWRASQNPEVALGSFAKGVRVGRGTR